ncbi:TlpA family protein disulfide reductase [Ascidiimonas sp. W6]|uniref:TlpA family protein disulfide reductase n=1 Tax=Ascidiimonas meishanensis TaxID=3128903 RepID=UPI0030EBCA71
MGYLLSIFLSFFVLSKGCNVKTSEKVATINPVSEIAGSITLIIENAPIPRLKPGPIYGASEFYKDLVMYTDDVYKRNISNVQKNSSLDTLTIETQQAYLEINLDDDSYQRMNLLLKNGDTLYIRYKEEVPKFELLNDRQIASRDLIISRDLRKIPSNHNYSSTIQFLYPLPFVPFIPGMSKEEYTLKFNEFKKNVGLQMLQETELQKAYLKKLLEKQELSQEVYLYYLNQLTAYQWMYRIEYEDIDLKLLLRYFKENDHLVGFNFYQELVQKSIEKLEKIKLINVSGGSVPDAPKAFDALIANEQLHGKTKAYALTHYLKEIIHYFSESDVKKYTQLYFDTVDNEILKKEITDNYLIDFLELKQEQEEVHLITPNKNKSVFKEVLNKHKGKLVYIDFWASWCKPCRAVMKDSKKLQKEYKDVVFVYISIDKDIRRWKKAMQKEGLSLYDENLLAVNYPFANFYEALRLNTIPRYLIYDRNGKLMHSNAPGPESKQIRALFEKALKEDLIATK